MVGINLREAVLFVQHLAARTGSCGNGIGVSVLEYRSAALYVLCKRSSSVTMY